jgi:hypothetical protein
MARESVTIRTRGCIPIFTSQEAVASLLVPKANLGHRFLCGTDRATSAFRVAVAQGERSRNWLQKN